jgi:hypothetical protein
MTQAVECQLCKWKALNSNSSPTQKKKRAGGKRDEKNNIVYSIGEESGQKGPEVRLSLK